MIALVSKAAMAMPDENLPRDDGLIWSEWTEGAWRPNNQVRCITDAALEAQLSTASAVVWLLGGLSKPWRTSGEPNIIFGAYELVTRDPQGEWTPVLSSGTGSTRVNGRFVYRSRDNPDRMVSRSP